MKTRQLTMLALVAMAAIASCKKEESDGGTPNAPVNPLRQTFSDNLENATQSFTVNAATGGFVQGQQGTQVAFLPNAFRTSSGDIVAGAVGVELVEVLSIGDMVWLNKQTLGNDGGVLKPLISGGQFYLNATQNGQQLELTPASTFVSLPATNGVDPNMELFAGTVDSDGDITWDPFANNPDIALDSSSYGFPNDSLGWVNCDYYMNTGTQTSVSVTCPSGHSESNTFVWLVFPDQNSVTCLHSASANVFNTGTYYTLPVGMNLKIVAIANINGAISSSVTSTVVSQNMNPSIVFSPTTLAQFQQDMQAL